MLANRKKRASSAPLHELPPEVLLLILWASGGTASLAVKCTCWSMRKAASDALALRLLEFDRCLHIASDDASFRCPKCKRNGCAWTTVHRVPPYTPVKIMCGSCMYFYKVLRFNKMDALPTLSRQEVEERDAREAKAV